MKRDRWNQRYTTEAASWPAEPCPTVVEAAEKLQADRSAMSAPHSLRALDLACGTGRNARYLAHHGWRVTAVDFSEIGIHFGRQTAEAAGLSITWKVADVVSWSPEPAQYDLALICYLQLPWIEMARVLDSAWRAVAPDGTLVVVGHDLTNLEHGTGGPQDPAVLYDPGQIADYLRAVADDPTVIVRAERNRRPVDHGAAAGTELEQIDCVVIARRPSAANPGAGRS